MTGVARRRWRAGEAGLMPGPATRTRVPSGLGPIERLRSTGGESRQENPCRKRAGPPFLTRPSDSGNGLGLRQLPAARVRRVSNDRTCFSSTSFAVWLSAVAERMMDTIKVHSTEVQYMSVWFRHRFIPSKKDANLCSFCGGARGVRNPHTQELVHTDLDRSNER